MRCPSTLLALALLASAASGQNIPKSSPRSLTVPLTLDHNHIVIDVDLLLPDGSTTRLRGWVDNGNPDLWMSQRVAGMIGATLTCDGHTCSAKPPREMMIGGMPITLSDIKAANIPPKSDGVAAEIAPGMSAEINLPSTVLRNYDVLINLPDHEFSIGQPGTLKFNGVKTKMQVSPDTGLIQIPSKIENKNYSLGLDLGSSFSFLSGELFDKLESSHAEWPRMTGAVGPVNSWGTADEPKWRLMRLDRLQYGPLFLTNIAVAEFPKDVAPPFENRGAPSSAGLLGTSALINYRVGIDYAHSTVYFDIGRTFNFPDFDVVGVILRPEADGRFTIIGVADFEGEPSVAVGPDGIQPGDHLLAVDNIPVPGSTMGQVWSQLVGSPGQERQLTIERAGKQFTVIARVRHFLGEATADDESRGKKSKKK